MIALVGKDIRLQRWLLAAWMMILVFFTVNAILNDTAALFIPVAVFAFSSVIIPPVMIEHDEKNRFTEFLYTCPIRRRDYVASKYIWGILFSVLSVGFTVWAFYLRGQSFSDGAVLPIFIVIAASLPLVISGLQLPFLFRFGVQTGRFVMIILYLAVFFLLMNLMVVERFFKGWNGMMGWGIPPLLLAGVIAVVVFVGYGVSFLLSVHFENQKEF